MKTAIIWVPAQLLVLRRDPDVSENHIAFLFRID
jgi:hypothetical protein